MAEAGGPALSEIQPQLAGVVDRVKSKLREVFTPTGRAEVMAQKQIDAILAQVPEDKRVEAMQILESKRPEFVAGKMDAAKGSLVRDAVIVGASTLVTAGGVIALNNERVKGGISTGWKRAAESGVGKQATALRERIRNPKLYEKIYGMRQVAGDRVKKTVDWILRRKPAAPMTI